jgi:hypothetical protein
LVRRVFPIRWLLVFGLKVMVGEYLQVSVQNLSGVWLTSQGQAQGGYF